MIPGLSARSRPGVFRTLTGADWRRAIARGQVERNPMAAALREKILALRLGKSQPEALGKINKGT